MDSAMLTTLTHALDRGGPVLWLIAALSVITLTIIFWKLWQMRKMGVWPRKASNTAIEQFETGLTDAALATLSHANGARTQVLRAAIEATHQRAEPAAREEITRQAKRVLAEARAGLRPLELIMTIAPLLGLLGTVLGMIDAFQALQDSGARADPSDLAGGIWEALLTTAAGMAVAIPAGVALSWFEALADQLQGDLEDLASRVMLAANSHRSQ